MRPFECQTDVKRNSGRLSTLCPTISRTRSDGWKDGSVVLTFLDTLVPCTVVGLGSSRRDSENYHWSPGLSIEQTTLQ